MIGVPQNMQDGDTVSASGGRLITTTERGVGIRSLMASIVSLIKTGSTSRSHTLQDADGTIPLLEINPVQSFQNKLINPRFDIWQRGITFTPALNTETYDADRFFTKIDGTSVVFTVSQQAHTLGTLTDEPTYFRRCAITTAGTASTITKILAQRIEGVRTLPGKKVILSFKAKADAARTITPNYVQCFGTGGAPSANVTGAGSGIALTTSWATYTQIITLPSISGKTMGTTSGTDYLELWLSAAANTVQTIDISDIEFKELATSAQVNTPFEIRPFQVELTLARRYVRRFTNDGANMYMANGGGSSATAAYLQIELDQEMRAIPTLTLSAASDFALFTGASGLTALTALSTDTPSKKRFSMLATAASGLIANQFYMMLVNTRSVGTAWIQFESEL